MVTWPTLVPPVNPTYWAPGAIRVKVAPAPGEPAGHEQLAAVQ